MGRASGLMGLCSGLGALVRVRVRVARVRVGVRVRV
jgi:hypothetical protein